MTNKIINKYCHLFIKIISAFIHILFALWVILALLVHLPIGAFSYGVMMIVALLLFVRIWVIFKIKHVAKLSAIKSTKFLFWFVVAVALAWFFTLTPSNDRIWQDEFEHQFSHTQQDNLITINHVRNFYWHDDTYDKKWETRQYDLNHLSSLDMISTTWGNDDIAHIMVSFGFDDGLGNKDKLVLSVETRKEVGEEFSTIGGFFRMYDLSIIAGDEKDLIYTRTNIREEKVSIYPVIYDKEKIKTLFLTYLNYGQQLNENPRFYHSLLSNCTTVIYEMIKGFDDIDLDYRVIVSGRLAEYLYDNGGLSHDYDMNAWRQMAFANNNVAHLGKKTDISSKEYSLLIRQNLPK